jgi:hypothetical protein
MRFSSLAAFVVVTASLAVGGCASSTDTDPVEETESNLTDNQKDLRAEEGVKVGQLAKADELREAAEIRKLRVGRPEIEPRPGFEKK